MRRLTWSRTAQRQLFDLADYYRQFDPELPETMLAKIEHAPLILLDFRENRVRGDTVQIQRVGHARSDEA